MLRAREKQLIVISPLGASQVWLEITWLRSHRSFLMKIYERGATKMQTGNRTKKIRVQVQRAVPVNVDPESLWFDDTVEPEQLIRLDPLKVTREMEQQAERPELADPILQALPARRFTLRFEALQMKTLRAQLSSDTESLEAFVTRLWGKGSP